MRNPTENSTFSVDHRDLRSLSRTYLIERPIAVSPLGRSAGPGPLRRPALDAGSTPENFNVIRVWPECEISHPASPTRQPTTAGQKPVTRRRPGVDPASRAGRRQGCEMRLALRLGFPRPEKPAGHAGNREKWICAPRLSPPPTVSLAKARAHAEMADIWAVGGTRGGRRVGVGSTLTREETPAEAALACARDTAGDRPGKAF